MIVEVSVKHVKSTSPRCRKTSSSVPGQQVGYGDGSDPRFSSTISPFILTFLADRQDQIERIRPSITRIESIISKSTKYDANSADKAASAGKIPEYPGRDPGVRRIISEYS
jgi:hypothetical protein